MKNIKKLIVILLMAVFTMTCFTSCFDSLENGNQEIYDEYKTYDYELNKDRVMSIDLIDYTPQVTRFGDHWGKGFPDYEYMLFDESKVVVKEQLPNEEIDAFLYELSVKEVYQLDQKKFSDVCNTPYGRCIRISYNDGTFDLISYGFFYRREGRSWYKFQDSYYTKFLSDGKILSIEHIESNNWYMLVFANYFDTKIEPIKCDVEYVEIV